MYLWVRNLLSRKRINNVNVNNMSSGNSFSFMLVFPIALRRRMINQVAKSLFIKKRDQICRNRGLKKPLTGVVTELPNDKLSIYL